jgi:hypothetical protein
MGVKLSWHRDDDLAELAALADGSLDPRRRAAAKARVAGSAELAALLAEQERALALMRSAAAAVEAPPALRARVAPKRRRRRPALIAASAAATLAAAVGAGVLSSGNSTQRFHMALGPTALAAEAAGDATLERTSSGWRIRLRAQGLPRRDGGRFYEAWLRNTSGVLVPVGTFNEGTDVTLWAGVSPKQFRSLTVTRERDDGNQASSGDKVLVGTVSS